MRKSSLSINKIQDADRNAHDWYRFVLCFPPHLVRDYLERFGVTKRNVVLDPFSGTGTTLVECKRLGIPSVGIEANPMAHFAGQIKTDWSPDPDLLMDYARKISRSAESDLKSQGIQDLMFFNDQRNQKNQLLQLDDEQKKLILADSISPLPLHKVLTLRETIKHSRDKRFHRHANLALAKTVVESASNLCFGPEVGVGKLKSDAVVIRPWLDNMNTIAGDIGELQDNAGIRTLTYHADARQITSILEPESVDFVFTSPPYPNEKDYTRTTRLESVILGFIKNKAELRALKQGMIRSNTRNVYKNDDDDILVEDNDKIQGLADTIERRRVDLGKTSGFERLYSRVTKLYFGGMARHLASLRPILKPGACLAYVVGDQASYLRVMIRTGQILAEIAESLGYEIVGIDLFRTRLATATKSQLREEVVLLQWKGHS